LRVASTLAGLTELPHRIHWEATPVVSVTEVAWVEHATPYFSADDGIWLVTSFLSPGRLTVTADAPVCYHDTIEGTWTKAP
jgi:hypothetical protein